MIVRSCFGGVKHQPFDTVLRIVLVVEQKLKFNLTETYGRRHYRHTALVLHFVRSISCYQQFFIVFLIALPLICQAQIQLSENDINQTIAQFKTENVTQKARFFKDQMPKPVLDKKLRQDILQNLPLVVKNLQIDSPEIGALFKKLILPLLEFYGRESVYEIIVFRHSTPVMFSDSGVVLVVSTGMIERAVSDDELIGYAAHEIGHEYFASYSIYSKYVLKLVQENGKETALKNKLAEFLALIELQCDAIAGVTLSFLDFSPVAFIESMEKVSRDFPAHSVDFHPVNETRRRLLTQILPKQYLQRESRASEMLKKLQDTVKEMSE